MHRHRVWIEQVEDFLVVDLEIADKDAKLLSVAFLLVYLFNFLEELFDAALSDALIAGSTLTLHRVGFA